MDSIQPQEWSDENEKLLTPEPEGYAFDAPGSLNRRILARMVLELQSDHRLGSSAIARILHVDEGWVRSLFAKNHPARRKP